MDHQAAENGDREDRLGGEDNRGVEEVGSDEGKAGADGGGTEGEGHDGCERYVSGKI